MVHCGEGDCTNNLSKKNMVSKWPGRRFIRFYLMPDPEKKKDLFLKWRKRIRRRPKDVKKSTRICSEHFTEEDFDPYDLANAQKAETTKKMWIRLKPDSIPNTDRRTGNMVVHFSTPVTVETAPWRPRRKRVRRDIEYIDELISENETILGSSPTDLENTEETLQEPSANDDHISTPSLSTNRYLSVLVSANTETCKGTQFCPSKKDCSTQTDTWLIDHHSRSELDKKLSDAQEANHYKSRSKS